MRSARVRYGVRAFVAAVGCAGIAAFTAGQAYADEGSDVGGNYVALGDSYTAGPLIPMQNGQPAACLRSDHNYPSLVNAALHSSSFKDVSCSGSTTKDMFSSQTATGNPPELNAVTEHTDLVSLGIGGNDIGFSDIILTCAVQSPTKPLGAGCRDYYNRTGKDEIAQRIDATKAKVVAVLEAIDKRAPDAKKLVVGYPTILPDSGPGCFPVIPFSPGDVAYLRQTTKRLNSMLADAADEGGAEFVDTYHSSIGHDVCKLPGTKWVEG
ncbi:MAG TPA: SGNH/GDSL hydrolase family protein, partial [Pseudonocardia sp.]|nr:SGNH/GDSL hydrolase family protein [Pseudonocardia sp.]